MLLYQRLYSIILVTLIITAAALFAVYVKLENIDIGTEGQFQLIQTKNIVEQQKQAQQQTYQQGTGKQSEQQKDVGQQILTVQENKVSTKTYFYGSSLLASRSNNIVTYYHDDYLGSVRLQSDTNARKTFSTRTLPFGSDVAESGSAAGSENSYKFTGQEQDDSLYYYGARYYDTRTGRFTQLDPAPSAESPYAYVSNNPLAFTDPTGKSMLDAELRAYNGGGYSGEELRQAGTDLIEWNNLPMSRAVDVTQMPFLGRLIVSGPFAARDPVAEDLYFFGYLSSAARAAGNVQARVPRVPKASPGIWSVALAGEKFLAAELRGIGAVRAGDETIVRFIYLVDRKQIIFVRELPAAKAAGVIKWKIQ